MQGSIRARVDCAELYRRAAVSYSELETSAGPSGEALALVSSPDAGRLLVCRAGLISQLTLVRFRPPHQGSRLGGRCRPAEQAICGGSESPTSPPLHQADPLLFAMKNHTRLALLILFCWLLRALGVVAVWLLLIAAGLAFVTGVFP